MKVAGSSLVGPDTISGTYEIAWSMPPSPPIGLILIALVLCAMLAAMFTTWVWAIGRLVSRVPLLPDPEPDATEAGAAPHMVPWGVGSVLLVLLLWMAV